MDSGESGMYGPDDDQPEMVAPSESDTPSESDADGRGRRRIALVIVLVAILTGAGGMLIGTQIESPADRAAARAAPPPSLITVPVERQELSSELVLNGEVTYNEPTPIELAGAVSLGTDETGVVTRAPNVGDEINEGGVILEITGRPVFAMQGELPMYRRMVIGTEGPDVAQIEAALVRLGFDVGGQPDPVFDANTAAAIDQMYTDAGYEPQGPSDEQQAEIEAAQSEVDSTMVALDEARQALSESTRPLPASEQLQLEHALNEARQAVPAAEAELVSVTKQQDQLVAAAIKTRDNATNAANAAINLLNAARNGAIDPNTGEPYAAPGLAELETEVAAAQQAITDAETAIDAATSEKEDAIAAAKAAIEDAEFNLQLAEAQYNEGTANVDTTRLQETVAKAETEASEAQTKLANLQAATGTRLAAGEIMFAPVLPTEVIESFTSVGAKAEGQLGTIATSETLVRARISRSDSGLVNVGSEVEIEVRDAATTLLGSVLSVGAPMATDGNETEGDGAPRGGEGGSSGRLEVVVAPSEGNALNNYVFYGARVRVTIDSTDGEVLVVPVAALTVGPNEQDQVEIEVTPATDMAEAVTKLVPVTVGLSANGLAEVEPVEPDGLTEGDRVVIGFEWEDRQIDDNRDVETDGETAESDSSRSSGSSASDEEGNDNAGGESEGGGESSPLAALFGYNPDPVAQRAEQLAIEEKVAECMKAEGFEYEPVDYMAQFADQAPEEEWGTDAFGEKHGYGVMYGYELSEINPDEGPVDDFVDPNEEYVNGLQPEEQQAYDEALHGAVEIDIGDTSVAPSLEDQGCYGQALAETVDPDLYNNPEISAEIEDFYANIEDDPGMQDLNQQWAACMEPALVGLDLPAPPQMPLDMQSVAQAIKIDALGQEVLPFNSEKELAEYESTENVADTHIEEDGTGYVVRGEPNELSGEEIDAATKREIELWKADRACQDEVGYEEYSHQLEQELVDRILEQFPELSDNGG